MKGVLHYVGLLLFFITTLLGGLLLGQDNVLLIIGAIVIIFIVYYLVKLMIEKKKETHPNLTHTLILWILYIAIAFFGGIVSLHFITVQFSAGDELKKNGNAKLEAINQMREEFKESVEEVKDEIYNELSVCLKEYQNAPETSLIKNEKKDILLTHYELPEETIRNRNIDKTTKNWTKFNIDNKIDEFNREINERLKNFYFDHKNVFKDMNYLEINTVYYKLDSFLINNKNELENGFSSVISKYNKNNAAFSRLKIPPSTVQLNSPTALMKEYNPIKYILIYLIIHLLILFPFLFTNKIGKKPRSDEDIATEL